MKLYPNILYYVPCINLIRVFFRKYGVGAQILVFICVFQLIFGYYVLHLFTRNDVDPIVEKEIHVIRNVTSSYNLGAPTDVSGSLDRQSAKYEGNLPCTLGKDALSAYKRAKTYQCKQEIADIWCKIQKGDFFSKRLERSCSSSGSFTFMLTVRKRGHYRGKNLGCYIEKRETRILKGYSTNLKSNSPSICTDFCLQRGFMYAGVEYSKECFCGDDDMPNKLKTNKFECNMTCAGEANLNHKCGGFLRVDVYQTGLGRQPPHALESDVGVKDSKIRIAFILTVNGRSLRQIRRLIKALYSTHHFFFIHVDSKQQYLYNHLLELESKFNNIRLSKLRFRSIWGGTSLLKVLLHSMETLLKQDDWPWDFVINLSESDYPIKTVDSLVKFLTANPDRNFLKTHGQNTNTFLQKQGLDRTFLECENHMWRIGRRQLPLGIRLDGGSDWFCLNRKFVEYVVHSPDPLVTNLKHFFSYTLLPAESFFHTVLRNSEYCNTFTDNNLHLTNWNRKLGCRCQYKEIVDWCGCSPNDFVTHDWHKLMASQSKHLYFARKFEAIKNLEIINKVDEWLFGEFKPDTPALHSYWENRYDFEDHPSERSDVQLTLYSSLLNASLQHIQNIEVESHELRSSLQTCHIKSSKLLQVHSYFQNDNAMGFVLSFDAINPSKQIHTFELFVRRRKFVTILPAPKFHQSVMDIQVGNKFDLKEQIYRDIEGALNVMDPLSVAIWLKKSSLDDFLPPVQQMEDVELYIEILLRSPSGRIVSNSSLAIDSDAQEQVLHHAWKTTVHKPPGIWTCVLLYNKEIVAYEQFAVLPLSYLHGSLANSEQISQLEEFYTELPESQKAGFGELESRISRLLPETLPDSLPFIQKIYHMVLKFYEIVGRCKVALRKSCTGVPICEDVTWSSFYPDPKSMLDDIDANTGRFTEKFRLPIQDLPQI